MLGSENGETGDFALIYANATKDFYLNVPKSLPREGEEAQAIGGSTTCFRTFSSLGLYEAGEVFEHVEHKDKPREIDCDVIFDTFKGLTFLALLDNNLKFLGALLNQLKESTHYEPEEDNDGNKVENVFYRRLHSLMLQKYYFSRKKCSLSRVAQ